MMGFTVQREKRDEERLTKIRPVALNHHAVSDSATGALTWWLLAVLVANRWTNRQVTRIALSLPSWSWTSWDMLANVRTDFMLGRGSGLFCGQEKSRTEFSNPKFQNWDALKEIVEDYFPKLPLSLPRIPGFSNSFHETCLNQMFSALLHNFRQVISFFYKIARGDRNTDSIETFFEMNICLLP